MEADTQSLAGANCRDDAPTDRADQVEKVYREFFTKFKKPSDAAIASSGTFRSTLDPLALPWQLLNPLSLVREIAGTAATPVPRTPDKPHSLPRVGDYVADAVSS